jgi:hypothetical protein
MNDEPTFHDDANGAVLRQMAADGDDLTVPREFAFSVIFPTEDAALKFAVALLKRGQKVSFSGVEEDSEPFWLVQAHPYMIPTHERISGYQYLLEIEAESLGGQAVGWGCES